jgi:hypothetical protein
LLRLRVIILDHLAQDFLIAGLGRYRRLQLRGRVLADHVAVAGG